MTIFVYDLLMKLKTPLILSAFFVGAGGGEGGGGELMDKDHCKDCVKGIK